MAYLLVVFIMLQPGVWTRGDTLEGWGAVRYETEAACLAAKGRAQAFQERLMQANPRAYPKAFVCVSVAASGAPEL